MHIAQFIHRYPPALGGAEAYTARLCEYLASRGDSVSVWTSTAVALEELWRRGGASPLLGGSRRLQPAEGAAQAEACGYHQQARVRRYEPLHFPGRRYILKALSLLPVRSWQCAMMPCNPVCPSMWRDARRYDGLLDAVHASAFPFSFPILCGLRLARRRGVPFFLTPFLHLGDPDDPRDSTRRQFTAPHLQWLLQQADGLFVQTRRERDTALSLGVRPDRIILQGLGVESSECTGGNRDAARAAWNTEAHEVVIGHLANNSVEKGTVDLLRVAERLWAHGVPCRVVLAGPEMPNFRAFWDAYEHKQRVVRLGVLSDEQKRDFFAGIDAFALPSRTDSFGLVLLEAWANGKPNLVYRAGGPAEIVRHEHDGLQARCGDIDELAMQLARLIAEPQLRARLGECGRDRIAREFRWRDSLELFRAAVEDRVTAISGSRNRFRHSLESRAARHLSPGSPVQPLA